MLEISPGCRCKGPSIKFSYTFSHAPSQLRPLPVNPGLQVHWKDPIVFRQIALGSHTVGGLTSGDSVELAVSGLENDELLVTGPAHSSMSTEA